MKKKQSKHLQLSKTVIAKIKDSMLLKIKGGTETVSEDGVDPSFQMSRCPGENTICEAIH